MNRDYVLRMYRYNDWANRETLKSLQQGEAPTPIALRRMGHLIGAEETWLYRLIGKKEQPAVWPELSLTDCLERLDLLRDQWTSYITSLPVNAWQHTIRYTNTKGMSFTSRIDDVLMHVVAHGAYHRGQIASDVRGQGKTPAVTDFIFYVRENDGEE